MIINSPTSSKRTTMHKMTFALPDSVADKFCSYVKKGERSKFISEAILKAIEGKERNKVFEDLKNLPPLTPKEDPLDILRKIRTKKSERIIDEFGKGYFPTPLKTSK